jgi:hypothetical protein
MMNPAIYLQEAERYQRDSAPRIHPKGVYRNTLKADSPYRYTREVLPCGCILIQLTTTEGHRADG